VDPGTLRILSPSNVVVWSSCSPLFCRISERKPLNLCAAVGICYWRVNRRYDSSGNIDPTVCSFETAAAWSVCRALGVFASRTPACSCTEFGDTENAERHLVCRSGCFVLAESHSNVVMQTFKQFFGRLFSPRAWQSGEPSHSSEAPTADTRPERQDPNPLPRHSSEEHVLFRPIGTNGALLQELEEWRRQGHAMQVTSMKTRVITCSGEVVSTSNEIKSVCAHCGGFTTKLVRCAACQVTLCELHARKLAAAEGTIVLCERHYLEQIENTWR